MIKARLIDDRGVTSYLWILIILIVSTAIIAFCLEMYQEYTIKTRITTTLERAGNMAVSVAMEDDYRMEKISRMNAQTARNEFLGYVEDVLELTGSYPRYRYNRDNLNFDIVIHDITIIDEPPLVTSNGEVIIAPFTYSWWTPPGLVVRIPVRSRSNNVRID